MSRHVFMFATVLLLASAARGVEKPTYAGPQEKGFLLPNGWTLTPAGEQIAINDLPLNILPLADGKRVFVSTNGYNEHGLYLIDLPAKKILDKKSFRESWFGLVTSLDQKEVWWSGGGADRVHIFNLRAERIEPVDQTFNLYDPPRPKATRGGNAFRSGMTLDRAGKTLYSLNIEAGAITALDVESRAHRKTAAIGGRPYDVVLARNGSGLHVSDWARRQVLTVDPDSLMVRARIPVGEHPNQIVLHPKDDRLFVACASSNGVWVIDTKRGIVIETIYTSLFPRAPEGSTPDALAISSDGEWLYVANADNNCVAVIEIEEYARSQVKGFIPTGWYPTALSLTKDNKSILVGVGKGNQTRANPIIQPKQKPSQEEKVWMPRRFPYIGTTLSGALSIVTVPNEAKLAEYTAQVYRNCPYKDEQLSVAPYPEKTAIPTKVGDPSPIEHVLYIIKENRTYDQVLGDMKRGNGDPSLVMFGEEVTPNHHKLANEFVLLDNLYCNGQVSRDGHPWSTMAYNTDYVARDWMLTYSGREGVNDDDEGSLSRAPSGYLWDACARAGLSYRSYGEYGRRVSQADGSVRMEAAVPGLIGRLCPQYGLPRAPNTKVRDTDNAVTFLEEFKKFEETGSLPRFMIMSLGEDHTRGTKPGEFTPKASVASNDLALGRIVEAISKSKYWPKIAIFVIEDDAQNGPDHVDAHRTVGLVISPYVKRGSLDSTQYQTVSMIRTIELILGLPPLSQFDAAARPMFACFTATPDLRPYEAAPARISLNEVNTPLAYGAERSAKMDFSEYDRIDDFELNEILWRSIKGEHAPIPPAVRRAIAFRASNAR